MATSIVVASGKGGVGKTSIAVNLGLTLSRIGRRVALLDADFGMANAHILLGVNPEHYIIDAIQGRITMEEALCKAPLGLKFVSGGSGLLEMLNLDEKTRYQSIRMMDELSDQADLLIADAPAGASDSSIAFVTAADRVIVILVGEPTSFLDAYALIKAAHTEGGVKNFCIVVNMARNDTEAKSHFTKFNSIASRFLDVNLTYAGNVPFSERMRQAVVKRRPIALGDQEWQENRNFRSIVKTVIDSPANIHAGIRFFADSAEVSEPEVAQ
jgi:flagellar biosynthesis protein FlhG